MNNLPNQPISPLGQPDSISSADSLKYQRAQQRIDWISPLISNPHFREFQRLRQDAFREAEIDLLDNIPSDPQKLRDAVVRLSQMKKEYERAQSEFDVAMETLRSRGAKEDEIALRSQLQRERNTQPPKPPIG